MPFDIDAVMPLLQEHFHRVQTPVVDFIAAKTHDPFKILVATILSARTKDETTTTVVNRLFGVVNTPDDLERISAEDLNAILFPVGFHNAKTQHLKQLPAVLRDRFGGAIPSGIEDLIQLPGVGRKTANLVRAMAFGLPAICVDIHVHRISNRWGYVHTKTPFDTEMTLREILPEKYWLVFNSYVVAFGQNLCTPRKPNCTSCPIYYHCPRVGV
ncbi:MAG: endonuclease III [Candidatus Cloacimonetes bacterium]|nr:endonuclease III [Candidatus Cloacimonadota bacterium]